MRMRDRQVRTLLFHLQVAGLHWRFTAACICGSLAGCGVRQVVVPTQCSAGLVEEPLVGLPRRGLLRVLHLGVLSRAPHWKLPAPPSSLPPRGINYGGDDFTSKTSRGSDSAVCLPDAFPFCWARGLTTIYRLPQLGATESLSSGHRAACCCRCGPCQVRPRTSCRTHHPSPSLPCRSLTGTGGACWAQGSQDPWTG